MYISKVRCYVVQVKCFYVNAETVDLQLSPTTKQNESEGPVVQAAASQGASAGRSTDDIILQACKVHIGNGQTYISIGSTNI